MVKNATEDKFLHRLQKLDQHRALNPWLLPKGSWLLGRDCLITALDTFKKVVSKKDICNDRREVTHNWHNLHLMVNKLVTLHGKLHFAPELLTG